MDKIDGNVFALISALVFGVLEAVKILSPKKVQDWLSGKEPVFSWILSIAGVGIAKSTGAFHATGWTDALLWATGSGIGAGAVHDYLWDPLTSLIKNPAAGAGGAGGSPAAPPSAGAVSKLIMVAVLVPYLVLGLGGCKGLNLNQKVMSDYKSAHDVILPEYLLYLDGKPVTLTPDQVNDRKGIVLKLQQIDQQNQQDQAQK